VSQAAGPGVVAVVATVGALPGHGVAINRLARICPVAFAADGET
jgi:hypothetical protein